MIYNLSEDLRNVSTRVLRYSIYGKISISITLVYLGEVPVSRHSPFDLELEFVKLRGYEIDS